MEMASWRYTATCLVLVALVACGSCQDNVACQQGASSYDTVVSFSQSYRQRYTTKCGFLNLFRCTRYRTRYRTSYTTNTNCCPGFEYSENQADCVDINECSSLPCQHGGSCNNLLDSFSCNCASGWYGTTCPYDFNECLSGPCSNGGDCLDLVNGFSCSCAPGWTGTTCEIDVDECASDPCQNGMCHDYINSFSCTCFSGWNGTLCNSDVNECLVFGLCNEGNCSNSPGFYSCTCFPGWHGLLCDTDINECGSYPCSNGGVCTDLIAQFQCTCANGWEGPTCQTDFDECESGPCFNEGFCHNLVNEYRCTCYNGWTGYRCETDLDECSSRPCHNGATCNNLRNNFTCDCLAGWTGSECETDMDECESSNHNCSQRCLNLGSGMGFQCACNEGYFLEANGATCVDIDECMVANDCDHQCNNSVGSYLCSCDAGYSLDTNMRTCIDVNECESDVCGHECYNIDGGFNCSCFMGYELHSDGTTCTDIDECARGSNCSQVCNNTEGGYACSCHPGYTLDGDWTSCNEIDECSSGPCNINGAWYCVDELNAYSCLCKKGWNGTHCENDVNECEASPTPCAHICTNSPGNYYCACQPGYALDVDGSSCSEIDECASYPCLNGECVDQLDEFMCVCQGGWTGTTCMEDIYECSSQPCTNGGMCNDYLDSFWCNCTDGWSGTRCETGFCASSPCLNGATCIAAESRCRCSAFFSGTLCSIDFDPNGIPTVTLHPVNTTLNSAEALHLSCRLRTVSNFDWWRNGRRIPNTRDLQNYDVLQVAHSDQGFYSCVGLTDDGVMIESDRALVKIRGVSIYPTSLTVRSNYTSSIGGSQSGPFQAFGGGIAGTIKDILNSNGVSTESYSVHVEEIRPGSGPDTVVVIMSSYISNSSRTSEEHVELIENSLDHMANLSEGHIDPSSIVVKSADLCLPTSWESPYGVVDFESDVIYTWTDSTGVCPWYTVNSGGPIARAYCSGNSISAAVWVPQDNCGGNITADLQISYWNENGTLDAEPGIILNQVAGLTDDPLNLTSSGVEAATSILEELEELPNISTENVNSVVTIVSNLASVDDTELETAQMQSGAPSRATQTLENILLNLSVSSEHIFQFVEPNLAVQVVNIFQNLDAAMSGFVFASLGGVNQEFDEDAISQLNGSQNGSLGEGQGATIFIPPEIIDPRGKSNLVFTVYRDDSLFVSTDVLDDVTVGDVGGIDGQRGNQIINTNVIGSSIARRREGPMEILTTPITFTLAHKQPNATNPRCVFWDYSSDTWSTEGCQLVHHGEQDTECSCNHLTNFAVLMDIHAGGRPVGGADRLYTVLSYIGCSFSILGLVATMAAYLCDSKLRRTQPTQILMCLCGTLLCLYICFIAMIAVDQRKGEAEVPPGPCGFLAGLLHFTTLSSVFWFGVEGVNMYLMVVQVLNSYISRFVFKAALIAWGVPALIVIITGAIANRQYAHNDYCFLQKWPLVGGLLVPMATVLTFNIVIFVLVMRRLSKSVLASAEKDGGTVHAHREAVRRVRSAFSVLLLLGLTWVLGYVTVIDDVNLVVHVFFIVLNSLQGFFIFLSYVLWQSLFRKRMQSHSFRFRKTDTEGDGTKATSMTPVKSTRSPSVSELVQSTDNSSI